MNQETHNSNLLRYFYDELSGSEKEEFERHLSECAVCRKELTELKALSEKISEYITPEVSQGVIDQIAAKAKAEAGKSLGGESSRWWRDRRLVWTLAGAIAAVIALGLSLWLVWEKPGEIDYEGQGISRSLTIIEQGLGQEEGLSFVALVSDSEDSLDTIAEDLSLPSPESASSRDGFAAMEQEIDELEELGNGILEI